MAEQRPLRLGSATGGVPDGNDAVTRDAVEAEAERVSVAPTDTRDNGNTVALQPTGNEPVAINIPNIDGMGSVDEQGEVGGYDTPKAFENRQVSFGKPPNSLELVIVDEEMHSIAETC